MRWVRGRESATGSLPVVADGRKRPAGFVPDRLVLHLGHSASEHAYLLTVYVAMGEGDHESVRPTTAMQTVRIERAIVPNERQLEACRELVSDWLESGENHCSRAIARVLAAEGCRVAAEGEKG